MIFATIINQIIKFLSKQSIMDLLANIINYLKLFSQKKNIKISSVTIYATKTVTTNGHEFVFPLEYNAILRKMIINNVEIKKIIKSTNFYNRYKNETNNFYIDSTENNSTFEIEKDIKITFIDENETTSDNNNKIFILKMVIHSQNYSLNYLKDYIQNIKNEYIDYTQTYTDDGKIYYFSIEDNYNIIPKENGKEKSNNIPSINWKKNIMKSFKTFDNTFFTKKELLLKKLDYFLNNEDKYRQRGIPYNIGILMHGNPGCGKTSCIKAISNMTKRHIVEVNLKKIKTCGEFESIFYNNALGDIYIPHDKKIIVLEDIDCMLDIVKSRNINNEYKIENENCGQKNDDNKNDYNIIEGNSPIKHFEYMMDKMEKFEGNFRSNDKLTLSCILNTIDGVLENYGRILIITTNHPEKLDSALIRPGRMDVKIEFTKCTNQMCHDIINNFFNPEFVDINIEFPEDKYTPAEILEICSINYDNIDFVVKKIINQLY